MSTIPPKDPQGVPYLLQFKQTTMEFDTDIFQEINDMEGEIFDIPEMQDNEKFDLDGYINGNYDY